VFNNQADRLRELSRGARPEIQQPGGIALDLYPHQVAAAEYATVSRRMLLADKDGTGRDLSAIAALVETAAMPYLITTPPSLVEQWREDVERALPSARIIDFTRSADITPEHLAEGDVVLVRHRQLTRSVAALTGNGFGGMVFDQCQRLACRWTQLAEAARTVVRELAGDATVVASSSRVAESPRVLSSAVELIGALDRHPRLAAVAHHRTWAGIPDAREIVEELRGDCLLGRGTVAVVALMGDCEAQGLASRH